MKITEKLAANNNGKILVKLASRNLRRDKTRTILTVLTICLSVSLISGLALFSLDYERADRQQTAEMQQVTYNNLSLSQCGELAADTRITDSVAVKTGTRSETEDYSFSLSYVQQTKSSIRTPRITEGRYPEKMNEAAVDRQYGRYIGRDLHIGSSIELKYYDGTSQTFTITGFTDEKSSSDHFAVYVSLNYARNGLHLKDLPFSCAVKVAGAEEMSEEEFLTAITEIGRDHRVKRTDINENNRFVNSLTVNVQEIAAIVLIGIFVLFVSVIVIYSLFYISVMSRVRQFGQLRTLGTSPGQIRKIVRKEGRRLFLLGAPLGLLIGMLFSQIALPTGFSPANAALVAVLTLSADYLTVMISVSKPARLASAFSPIDASRADAGAVSCRKRKNLHQQLTPWTLAKIRILQDRKKFALTVLSLCVSGTVFMAGSTFSASFDKLDFSRQGYFQNYEYQLSISENAVNASEEGLSGVQKDNPLTSELINRIRAVEGVDNVSVKKKLEISYIYQNNNRKDCLVPFTRQEAEILSSFTETPIDYDDAVRRKAVYIVDNQVAEEFLHFSFQTGDEIEIAYFDGEKEKRDTFVIAGEIDPEVKYDEDGYEITGSAGFFVIPDALLKTMTEPGFNLNDTVLISSQWPEKDAQITAALENLQESDVRLSLNTLSEKLEKDRQVANQYLTLVMSLCAFCILFSVINLINTIITNVLSRKHEFAVLESIGMEKKQLERSIQYEGLIFAFFNIVISCTLGAAIGYLIISLMNHNGADYLHYQYPALYAVCYSIFVILLPVAVSLATVRIFRRQSVVQRLRETE